MVGGKEVGGVARAETVGRFGCEAVFEEPKFDLGIVEGGEEIKDVVDFANAMVDDAPREGNVAHRCAEEEKSSLGGARDTTLERVGYIDFRWKRIAGAAPNKTFLSVDDEAQLGSLRQDDVIGALEGGAITG